MKTVFLTCIFILFVGCSENGEVFINDKNILSTKIECMGLSVFPPNKQFESTLRSLYSFDRNCSYELFLSYKTDIVCNSNQNWAQKTSRMPSGYLRLELKKEGALLYTYYKDLKTPLNDEEIRQGFEQLQSDLKF